MKVIIAGSRDYWPTTKEIDFWLNVAQLRVTEVVSGKASGVDTMGEKWAKEKQLPVKEFPAKWKQQGFAAGPLRNQEMAEYADACIAIPDRKSKGTWNMVANMKLRGKPVFVWGVEDGFMMRPDEWKEPNTPPAFNPGESIQQEVSKDDQ